MPPPPAPQGSCCRRAPSHRGPKSSRPPHPVPSSPAAPAAAGGGTALQTWTPPAMLATHPRHPLWGRSPGVQAQGGGSFQGGGEGVESRSQRWLHNVVNVLTGPCTINPTLQFSSRDKVSSFDVLVIQASLSPTPGQAWPAAGPLPPAPHLLSWGSVPIHIGGTCLFPWLFQPPLG